jgi:hypothetical protein
MSLRRSQESLEEVRVEPELVSFWKSDLLFVLCTGRNHAVALYDSLDGLDGQPAVTVSLRGRSEPSAAERG